MAGSRDNGGLSIQTLVIASVASATAALVVSQFWKGGTVMSAAITPVIVAIVSELLRKPAKQVTRFTSVTREDSSSRGGRIEPPDREPSIARLERLGGEISTSGGTPPPPEGPREGAMRVYSGRAPRRRLHWRVALLTGLLAFAIAAVVITVPELIAGGEALGDRTTTLFGGGDESGGSQDQDGEQPQDAPGTTTQPGEQPEGGSTAPEQTQPQEQPPPTTAPEQAPPQETQPPQSQPAP